jgi:hypothetical protein
MIVVEGRRRTWYMGREGVVNMEMRGWLAWMVKVARQTKGPKCKLRRTRCLFCWRDGMMAVQGRWRRRMLNMQMQGRMARVMKVANQKRGVDWQSLQKMRIAYQRRSWQPLGVVWMDAMVRVLNETRGVNFGTWQTRIAYHWRSWCRLAVLRMDEMARVLMDGSGDDL